MLRICRAEGCTTLTLGSFCVSHEPPVEPRRFPRGRPYRMQHRDAVDPVLVEQGGKERAGVVLLEGAG